MKPRPLLARLALVAGVATLLTVVSRGAPHEQTIAIRLHGRDVTRVESVVTAAGEAEPTAGLSQNYPGAAPHTARHSFSAPDGEYSITVTFLERLPASAAPASRSGGTGDAGPNPRETSFERRVSLAGGEVIISPD